MTFPSPYRARPARRDDLDALVELFEARDLADVGFVDQARDEIVEDWASVRFEFDRDTVIAEASDGTIAAYGVVLALDPTVQIFAMGKVHPRHAQRGLGAALLRETERLARDRLPAGVRAPFRTGVPETDRAATDLLAASRYRLVRSFWHMERDLLDGAPVAEPPIGVSLRTGDAGDDEVIAYGVLDEAFRENFGYEPISQEDWLEEFKGWPSYDPTLTVLAFEGDRPVGISINNAADDGIGWVADLGVLPGWRRRGIGKALLLRSFAELAARGQRAVRLGVDSENASGATHLYQGAGMTIRRRFDLYEKVLTGA
jgi:ribosomal protein S18 acetylase RimI-like enzyme